LERLCSIFNVLLTFIVVYRHSKTNVMHFLFSLLRITCLYMFRALLDHLQEALRKRHLVYSVRVMSVGCYQDLSGTPVLVATNWHNTQAVYQVSFV
jgi:hypothetical protein